MTRNGSYPISRAKVAKLEPAGGVLDWRREELPPFYVEPDGSMVPMRPEDRPEQKATEAHPGTHREAKMAVLFWGSDVINVSPKRRVVLKKSYVATIGGVDEFRDKLWAATVAVTGAKRFQPVVLGDRADWITNLTDDLFPDAIRIVDIYHPLGDRQMLREKCEETTGYIEKRRAFMDYATYLAKGLMIGSGIIESSHKRVIGQRLKQAGMHWSLEGANAMVHLRALRLSDGPGWGWLWKRLAAG